MSGRLPLCCSVLMFLITKKKGRDMGRALSFPFFCRCGGDYCCVFFLSLRGSSAKVKESSFMTYS